MNRPITFRTLARAGTLLLVVLFGAGSVAQGAPSIAGFRLPFEGGPFSIVQGPSCPQYSHSAVPEAIDFMMPEGTNLVAVQSGTVVFVGWDGNYGNQVRVTHDNGLTSWYNHIQPNGFRVSLGDRVTQGQVIALSGTTGKSDGPHLHFEVREGGTQTPIDALPGISWNAENGGRCTGLATGGPAATSNKKLPLNNCFTWLNDTRIDCFVRGTDNRMYQRYWNGGGWSEFDLGGTLASAPTCFPWLNDTRIDCFVRGTDNRMYQRYWNGGWSDWIDLGGTLASAPTCFPWLNGSQIHCFARGIDNRMYQRFWNGDWSDWIDLGGTLASAPTCSPWFNESQIHCFARGTDNRMYQRFWNGSWSAWVDLGGTLASAPTCLPWLNESQVHCFARGTDNRMYQRFWNGGGWSDWVDLGGTLASAPTCFPWLNGSQIHCFARGTDNRMYQRFWNGGWSDWINLGGALRSAPTCFSWLNDTRIDCFGQGTDNSLQQRYWNGGWSNWINLGGSVNLTIVDTSPQVTLSPLQLARGAQQNESGSGFTPNGPLHMSIRLPDGTYYEQALQADANGRFAYPYTMPMNAQLGHYAYRIQDLTSGLWSNTVEYDVLPSAPTVFSLSGRITDSSNLGLVGVTLSDGTRSATTDATGTYTFTSVPAGSYTLTPTKSDCTFTPTSRAVTVPLDSSAQNFTATCSSTEPYFKSDYTLGKPGSVFVFTAGNFPANAQATIAIRRPGMSDFVTLRILTIPTGGTLIFVFDVEASAAPGVYTVRITVESTQPLSASAETQAVLTLEQPLTIAEEAILHDDPPPQGAPVVPASGVKVFLPLLMR